MKLVFAFLKKNVFFVFVLFILLFLSACDAIPDNNPIESQPVESQPVETQPVESNPVETQLITYTLSIVDTDDMNYTLSHSTAESGQLITITLTPVDGKEIDQVVVKKGAEIITVSDLTFVMPDGDVTVEVTMKDVVVSLYTVTLPSITGVEVDLVNTETSFASGTEVELDVIIGSLYKLKAGSLKYVFGQNQVTIVDNKFIMPNGNVTIIIEVEQIILPMVTDIILSLMDQPDPWEFLPESFAIENRIYTGATTYNYNNFVALNTIPDQGMGKQMNVLYDIMVDVENALSVITPVYQISNQVASLYQNYINDNPEDFTHFETTVAGITVVIDITDQGYSLSITYGAIAIDLYYDDLPTGVEYGGRIQLSEANVVKYEVGEDHLVIAARLAGTFRAHIEFVRDDNGVRGTLYHFIGVNEIGLSTRALLHVGTNHTTIIGEKGDFLPTATTKRNVEVYSNSTGKMVGGEVKESVPIVGDYDTMWYPIQNITGISNVKATDVVNGNNPNTIYINNSSTVFNPHTSFFIGARYYDIELKTQYFYTYNVSTDTYTKVEVIVPMFFIQRSYEDNSGYGPMSSRFGVTMSNTANINDKNAIYYGYDVLLPIYDTIRENMTPQMVIDYVATVR